MSAVEVLQTGLFLAIANHVETADQSFPMRMLRYENYEMVSAFILGRLRKKFNEGTITKEMFWIEASKLSLMRDQIQKLLSDFPGSKELLSTTDKIETN